MAAGGGGASVAGTTSHAKRHRGQAREGAGDEGEDAGDARARMRDPDLDFDVRWIRPPVEWGGG